MKLLSMNKTRKSFLWMQLLLLLALLFTTEASKVTLHLDHPSHTSVVKRHELASHKHIIHHDMRVFRTHNSHLSHDTVLENYEVNDMGYYFTLNLTVGGLPYRLNIDTGSSDIFIKGEQSAGQPKSKYSCHECLENNQEVTIAYLDGALSTYKAILPVNFGQHNFNESILVAYLAPHNFEVAEGLVGLSFPQLAKNKDPTFIQTLINNKIIRTYAFGVNLNFQQHHRSFISFGEPDTDLFEGNLKNYSILNGYSYAIKINGISINDGQTLPISSALLDTGNTCISIPSRFEQDVLKKFNSGGNICGFDNQQYAPSFSLLRCKVKDYSQLPSFKIHIGKDVYDIDQNVYMQRCIKKPNGDYCDTYIESVKSQTKLFLGDGFFNRYYTYFDLVNRQIGFAKNKQALSYTNMYIDESQMDSEDKQFFAKLQ